MNKKYRVKMYVSNKRKNSKKALFLNSIRVSKLKKWKKV